MNELNTTTPSSAELRNVGTINKWLPVWFNNMRKTIPIIENIFQDHGNRNAEEAIPDWFKKSGNGCALVIGSGASLEYLSKDMLADWNGLVIAGASNCTIPAALGHPADIILAIDSAPETAMQLRWLGSSVSSAYSRLVTNPYIHPDALRAFPQDRIYFYKSFIPYAKHPLNWYLSLLFQDLITNFILQAGCTANSEYAWCLLPQNEDKTPYIKKVFLLGVDYCYPQNPDKSYLGRARSYKYNGGNWIQDKHSAPRTRSGYVMYEDRIFTDQAMLGYKQSLLTLWVISKMPTYNLSNTSIISEIPHDDLWNMVNSNGACGIKFSSTDIQNAYRKYMKKEGNELVDKIETQNGATSNPDLPRGLEHQVIPTGILKTPGDTGTEGGGEGEGKENRGPNPPTQPPHVSGGPSPVARNLRVQTTSDSEEGRNLGDIKETT